MKDKIGFVGLGLMGTQMAARILNAGYQLFVFNRTKEKAQGLLSKGAIWCASPAIVAIQADIIFSMVSTPMALGEITLGNNGILSGIQQGKIHIDCSTVSPELIKKLAEAYQLKGGQFLHSPVLGSVSQVIEGSLLLFVGGNDGAYKRAELVLRSLGSKIWRFDRAEQATTTKLLCNSFISGMSVILAQALVLAKKAEIDPRILLEIVSHSQLNAPMYQAKGSSIIERNFAPRFFVEHLLKDINLVLDLAHSLDVPFPISTVAQDLFTQAVNSGLAQEDYSSVVKVLEAQAGIKVN
jgi:3-hydroxyisobutyrate dehydrogenase-like beta-hydroxyacid dehydrogenase